MEVIDWSWYDWSYYLKVVLVRFWGFFIEFLDFFFFVFGWSWYFVFFSVVVDGLSEVEFVMCCDDVVCGGMVLVDWGLYGDLVGLLCLGEEELGVVVVSSIGVIDV